MIFVASKGMRFSESRNHLMTQSPSTPAEGGDRAF